MGMPKQKETLCYRLFIILTAERLKGKPRTTSGQNELY